MYHYPILYKHKSISLPIRVLVIDKVV